MTKLINKTEEFVQLYFTLDRVLHGEAMLLIRSDFDKTESHIQLPQPSVSNERYTAFILDNPFKNYADGLYTYVLTDDFGSLETGSIKIQSEDFGTPNYTSYNQEDDNYIVFDGDQY